MKRGFSFKSGWVKASSLPNNFAESQIYMTFEVSLAHLKLAI